MSKENKGYILDELRAGRSLQDIREELEKSLTVSRVDTLISEAEKETLRELDAEITVQVRAATARGQKMSKKLEITDKEGDVLFADNEVGLSGYFIAILEIRTKERRSIPCVGLSKEHALELYDWLGDQLEKSE